MMSHLFLRMLSQHPSHCLYKAANFCILVISYLDVDENTLNMMNHELKNLEELCSNVRAADAVNKQKSKSNCDVAKSQSPILYFNNLTALVTCGEHEFHLRFCSYHLSVCLNIF